MLGVFEDGAVAAELADAGGVEDGHLDPAVVVFVGGIDLGLGIDIELVVSEAEVWVAVLKEAVAEGFEFVGVAGEVVAADPVDGVAQGFIAPVVFPGVVAFVFEFHYGPKSDIASIGWRTPDRSRIVRDVLVNHGGSEIHLGFSEQGNRRII